MMRPLAAVSVIFAIVIGLGIGAPARAGEGLRLTPPLIDAIAAACPDCATRGVIACGDQAVESGRRWYSHALQGTPPRAYVMSWPMGDTEMRKLSEAGSLEMAQSAIAARFGAISLVAIEADGSARNLGHPSAKVTLPPGLHACLADPGKPWGCCAAGCGEAECCEKSLGSHRINLAWQDPASGDRLGFSWSRNGGSTLLRRSEDGTKTAYFCLVWSALPLD